MRGGTVDPKVRKALAYDTKHRLGLDRGLRIEQSELSDRRDDPKRAGGKRHKCLRNSLWR